MPYAPLMPQPRRRLVAVVLALVGASPHATARAETAADAATRSLLEKLDERGMPDVALWVLDRLATDPDVAAELKAEVPFRRALALVAASRTEADGKKKAARFDEAQALIDEFLVKAPSGWRAIDAYTQKGNLLVERGRLRLEQAKRPGADVAALRKEAAGFFDQAIKSLEGKVKPGEGITRVDNAEDAVLKELRDVKARIAAIKPKEPAKDDDKKGPKKPVRRDTDEKELERLEADQESLQAKLVQTRLMVASAYFEKARAYDEKSKEWKATLEASTNQFKEIADKYPTLGGGLFARYYEGRNLAALGEHKKAVDVLAGLVALEDKVPLAVLLRAKALTTSLECWLALAKTDASMLEAFDDKQRAFAVDEPKQLRGVPEPDRLALKYRAAVMLREQAEKAGGKNAARGTALRGHAGRLALEVARVNRDFAAEARELVQSLGKDVIGAADEGFEGLMADAKSSVQTMQQRQAEAKKLLEAGQDPAASAAAAAEARDAALAAFDAAIAKAQSDGKEGKAASEAAVNYARYMQTYLFYDAKRYAEAGDLGALLVSQFPNGMGSRQAGMIALASWQQLARATDAAAATAAKQKLVELARSIATIWPNEKEGAEALSILVTTAIESKDPRAIVERVDTLPKGAAGRPVILGRAGAALWREVVEQGRVEEATRLPAETLATWKQKARSYLDEALASPPGAGSALRVAVAAALARAQIALDDGDAKAAVTILEQPTVGPWIVVNDPQADPTLREGSFAEAGLTVALRAFIQAEQLDKAQQAMDRLETLAGAGESEEKSARLTAMYLSMGRELQEQLERLGGGETADGGARGKAVSILGGFEKFLDGLAKRDSKVSSQIWVATTYLTLGSGQGTGAVVPKPKADQYLDRAADVYTNLLARKDDPDVARFEPSIRLKIAAIYRARGKWDLAQEQIDWILSDAKRQNSLDTQVQAAEILQAAAQALAGTDAAAAETRFREATTGRSAGPTVIWGWGGIANKVSRQAFAGADEKSLRSRDLFFTARLNQASCLLARAQLPGKPPEQAGALLEKAETAVAVTRKMYPDLGGPAMTARFEKLLKEIQKQRGAANPRGFADLDEKATAAATPAAN